MKWFRSRSVRGVALPRRRFTGWAALYFIIYICLPILGLAFAADVLLYLLFTRLLDRCYGVLCLLG